MSESELESTLRAYAAGAAPAGMYGNIAREMRDRKARQRSQRAIARSVAAAAVCAASVAGVLVVRPWHQEPPADILTVLSQQVGWEGTGRFTLANVGPKLTKPLRMPGFYIQGDIIQQIPKQAEVRLDRQANVETVAIVLRPGADGGQEPELLLTRRWTGGAPASTMEVPSGFKSSMVSMGSIKVQLITPRGTDLVPHAAYWQADGYSYVLVNKILTRGELLPIVQGVE